MFRYMIAVFVWCLSTAVAQAAIIKSQHQVIDFTQLEQAAKLAKWSDPKTLGCNKDGFGWNGDGRSYRDGWIETEPLAIGTVWRPTQRAGIQIKLQTNYPAVVGKGNSKSLDGLDIYVRYSADRSHWSDWQPTEMKEDPRLPGTLLYTARVGVPRRSQQTYKAKFDEWSRRDDIAWASDEDAFCSWLVKQEPDFFAKERPFVGYVQFLIESSFKGGQRLSCFEADVIWTMSGFHHPSQRSNCEKKE